MDAEKQSQIPAIEHEIRKHLRGTAYEARAEERGLSVEYVVNQLAAFVAEIASTDIDGTYAEEKLRNATRQHRDIMGGLPYIPAPAKK